MLLNVVIVLMIICLCVRHMRLRKFSKSYNQTRTESPCLPFIGHAYKFFGDSEVYMKGFQYFGREAVQKDGIVSKWLGDVLVMTIADPILADSVSKTCMEKGDFTKFFRYFTGNGSLFAPAKTWRPRRKVSVQIFSQKNLIHFVSIFGQQSSVLVKQLEPNVDGKPFPVWNYVTTYAMDAVCETTLGVKIKAQENINHPFLKGFEDGTNILTSRALNVPLHSDFIFSFTQSCCQMSKIKTFMYDFFAQIISTKRKEMDHSKKDSQTDENHNKPFLELLLESSNYSDVELREEMIVIMMAGMDTSAVGVCFALLMLARHQDHQRELYQEIIEKLRSEPITFEGLSRLKKMDLFVRETLRLYPPVPIITRYVDRDVMLPNGMKLIQGTDIMVNVWALHRNPKFWGPDAEVFRPERFLEPLTHPAQFMPFSYGPRNCIGYQYAMLSMKTVLATLLRQYQVLTACIEGEKEQPLRLKFEIMMKDINKFVIRLTRREK